MSLRNDTIHNVSGSLAPAAAAFITVPLLLGKIGDVRFGILALVWLLLGHFGVFDFGLSRATANRIARLEGADALGRRQVFWTSLWMNLGFGVLGAGALYLLAEPLLHLLDIGEVARSEVRVALPWIAATVPLATLAGVLGGALDGRARFDVANGLQAVGAVIVQVTPVAAAYAVSPELDVLIPASVLARAFSVLLLLAANLRLVAPGRPLSANGRHARELFKYGAWLSVSALIVPFFMTLDKFMVGAILGPAAVAYYSVPDQLVRRISVLPLGLARSVFSRISASDASSSRDLAQKSAIVLISVVTPGVVTLIVAMQPFLSLWIGAGFSERASVPGILLAAGIWLNSLALIPSVYLQATGRPDVTAKCHVIEILPHVAILWACVRLFGTVGAAAAMLIVTILDTGLLMAYARMPLWRASSFWKGAAWIAGASAIGVGDYREQAWRYGAAVAIAVATGIWGIRTSPDLSRMAATLVYRIPALRRGA